MIMNAFASTFNTFQISMLGVLIGCILTFVMLNCRFGFLPKDQGRAFAINGELSKGKLRGVGLVVTICYLVVSLIFVPFSVEYLIFCVLLFAIMLSGYLDDASKIPWSDYKKGLIDLIICILYMVTFIHYNSTDIYFFSYSIHLNPIVYGILGIILIWVSINVTNCSDGVDGLCGSLSFVTIASYGLIFATPMKEYSCAAFILCGCIIAYLYFNTSPSSMLMGDAGSRAFGFFIAVLAMKSGHPFSFIILTLVMIIDGGLGLVKIFLLRFLKIKILANTRTPIHDELRKNRGWADSQVVNRLIYIQLLLAVIFFIIL